MLITSLALLKPVLLTRWLAQDCSWPSCKAAVLSLKDPNSAPCAAWELNQLRSSVLREGRVQKAGSTQLIVNAPHGGPGVCRWQLLFPVLQETWLPLSCVCEDMVPDP